MSKKNKPVRIEGDIVYYHSKLDFDPLKKGRRVTICAIIAEDRIQFGISKGHILDARKWNRKLGREISHGRASEDPILTLPKPTEKIKHFAVMEMKKIWLEWLLTGKEGRRLSEDEVQEKLAKKRRALDKLQDQIDKEAVNLVETTTRLKKYLHPEVETEKTVIHETVGY